MTGPRLRRIATAMALGALALSAPAAPAAADTGSALDQYIESVPGADGERPSNEASGAGEQLTPDAVRDLQELGSAGEATARLADLTSPKRSSDPPDQSSDESGDGGPSAVAGRLLNPTADGIGFVLPLVLALTLVSGLAFVLHGRLRKPGERA